MNLPWLGDTSRMNRASGICERLEKQFPGATRQDAVWQRALVATCKDSRNEVMNRRRGEPTGLAHESI
jgi:hypothetical protein